MTTTDTLDRKQEDHTRGAVLLLGSPGSSKTTLADALTAHEEIAAIKAGDLLKERLRADAELSRCLKLLTGSRRS